MEVKKRSNTKILGWGKILILALVVVLFVRFFFLESYHIASSSMETAVLNGDFVIVNKMPFRPAPERNTVVLFTSPLRKDTVAEQLFLSRCVGLPGDTLELIDNTLKINGKEVPKSPHTLARYTIENSIQEVLLSQMKRLSIPVREAVMTDTACFISLTPFEEYRIRDELPQFMDARFKQLGAEEYKLVVPRKDRAYRLDPVSLTACKEIILAEAGKDAVIRDGKLYLDGRETTFFFFKHNYYWLLSDNTSGAIDSRHLGFVPEEALVGKAWCIWLSKDPEKDIFHGYRWSRLFNSVY